MADANTEKLLLALDDDQWDRVPFAQLAEALRRTYAIYFGKGEFKPFVLQAVERGSCTATSDTSGQHEYDEIATSQSAATSYSSLDGLETDMAELNLISETPKAEANAATLQRAASLVARDAYTALDGSSTFPATAMLGHIVAQHLDGPTAESRSPIDSRLLLNVAAPSTAVLCGVQGSGKSHALSVLLENTLSSHPVLAPAKERMLGLTFHFETVTSGTAVRPCEAAYLSSADPSAGGKGAVPTVVIVSPKSVETMRRVYSGLPNVRVEAYRLTPDNLNVARIIALMGIDISQPLPLYLAQALGVLQDLGADDFSLDRFHARLAPLQESWQPVQKDHWKQRTYFLDRLVTTKHRSLQRHFAAGTNAIIDLTDPFLDPSRAASLFDLALGLFLEVKGAKVIALDEAHKYLTGTEGASILTASLAAVIRQQRHLGARVIISSQEPTIIPPTMLDLCTFALVFGFSAPKWSNHIGEHLNGLGLDGQQLYKQAVTLQPGEALCFSPSALVMPGQTEHGGDGGAVQPIRLGSGYLRIRTRKRVTLDGGASLLAVA